MNNRITLVVWIISIGSLLSSCGAREVDWMPGLNQAAGFSCLTRPGLLRPSDLYSLAWSSESPGLAVDVSIDPGDTEWYLDWGGIIEVDGQSAVYEPPDFIAESRKLNLLIAEGGRSVGSCPVYLLDGTTYGVADDGAAAGLVASVYPVSANTPGTSFPTLSGAPSERSVLYDVNFSNVPNLRGVSVSSQFIAMVITGTIELPESNDYFFRLTANHLGNLYIDGVKVATSMNGGAGTSGSLAYGLDSGKHDVKIEYLKLGTGATTLRLEWANRISPTAFSAFTVVPHAAFDRR